MNADHFLLKILDWLSKVGALKIAGNGVLRRISSPVCAEIQSGDQLESNWYAKI